MPKTVGKIVGGLTHKSGECLIGTLCGGMDRDDVSDELCDEEDMSDDLCDATDAADDFADFWAASGAAEATWKGPGKVIILSKTTGKATGAIGAECEGWDCCALEIGVTKYFGGVASVSGDWITNRAAL